MLDPDTFLTILYVVVDDVDKTLPPAPAHPGPAPALSRSEVVTLGLFGQWACFPSERAFYRYAQRHLRAAFPHLPARSQFNRQLRRTHAVISAVAQWVLPQVQRQAVAFEVLDSLGAPVRNVRRRGSTWLAGQADLGYCTRLGWYYGLHVLTACLPSGVITGVGCGPASTDDRPLAETLLAARHTPQARLPEVGQTWGGDLYLADTGFEGHKWLPRWRQVYGVTVVCPPKRTQAAAAHAWPRVLRRWAAGLREIIETVHARLLLTFGLEHERPHTLSGFRARLAAKVALHTCCCWLNHQLGRPLLAFADLVDW